MNKLTDYILELGSQLYRYDLVQPPQDWNVNYKNPEYVSPEKGAKNQIGAFFFFSSLHQADNTAKCAVKRYGDKSFDGIWITECTIREPIKLLDLRESYVCIELLAALDKAGFQIFSDKFRTWDDAPFSNLKPLIQPVEEEILSNSDYMYDKRIVNVIREVFNILKIQMFNIGHLSQLFTDYSNGVCFKCLLQSKGYEGYIFNETNMLGPVKDSDTICIFDSIKLNAPKIVKHQIV